MSLNITKAVVTTTIRLRLGFDSIPIRPPFDYCSTEIRPRYDHLTAFVTTVWALRPK